MTNIILCHVCSELGIGDRKMKAKEKTKKKTADAYGPDLLRAWVEIKLREYPEPQRKGTPKGDPIGIGAKKYIAILFFLTNTKVKRVAELAGVSHGVLRNWRTEGEFKKQVNTHLDEFAEYWLCAYAIPPKSTYNKISDLSKLLGEWDPAMACVPDFSDELGKAILKLAFSRFKNKRKADKQWWKKRGYSDSDEIGRLIFIAEVCHAFGESSLLEAFRPLLEKLFCTYLKWHIQPEKGRPKIDKEKALLSLYMLENLLGVHDIK